MQLHYSFLFIFVILSLVSSANNEPKFSATKLVQKAVTSFANVLTTTNNQFLRASNAEDFDTNNELPLTPDEMEQEKVAVQKFIQDLPPVDAIYNHRRLANSTSTCNMTAYTAWANQIYYGTLAGDSSFWIYQTQPQIYLTNYLALQLAVRDCRRMLTSLTLGRAGKMGPVTIQDSYKIMCRPYCLQSDAMHEEAMAASGCSCLELSTQPTEPAYTSAGDWCEHNSARLLCSTIGYCGLWQCAEEDFMCPRFEWNKKYITYKGLGTCIRGAASSIRLSSSSSSSVMAGMAMGLTLLWTVWLL